MKKADDHREGDLIFLVFHIFPDGQTLQVSPECLGDGGISGSVACLSPRIFPGNSPNKPCTERRVCYPRWRHQHVQAREKDSGEPLSHLEGALSLPFPIVCQNCIDLNAGTVSSFVFAEIISFLFLAVGVYFIAGQDGVRQSRGKRMFLSEKRDHRGPSVSFLPKQTLQKR